MRRNVPLLNAVIKGSPGPDDNRHPDVYWELSPERSTDVCRAAICLVALCLRDILYVARTFITTRTPSEVRRIWEQSAEASRVRRSSVSIPQASRPHGAKVFYSRADGRRRNPPELWEAETAQS